ncbi:MAG: hypothetical protein AAFZ52_07700 [Bacteroidota bacterium]
MKTSYYRIIKGVRYDANLLDDAHARMARPSDGRISVADAKALLQAAADGPGVTNTEWATLGYILRHYNCTKPAAKVLADYLEEIIVEPPTDPATILSEFALAGVRLGNFTLELVEANEGVAGDKYDFPAAFRTFLGLLLQPGKDREAPYNLVRDIHEFDPAAGEVTHERVVTKLREYLNEESNLFLLHPTMPHDPEGEVQRPEHGEDPAINWVFYLNMESFSDHSYWGVLPRDGGIAYIYGFN